MESGREPEPNCQFHLAMARNFCSEDLVLRGAAGEQYVRPQGRHYGGREDG